MQNYEINPPEFSKPNHTIFNRAIKGGFWVIATKITQQLLVMLRLIVMARLLAPEDFGLMGIVLLALATINKFTQTGFTEALIQKKVDTVNYLNTAWTLGIIRGLVLFIVLYLSAPFIGIFFNQTNVVGILRVASISFILEPLSNIGMVYFAKELEFNKQFIQNMIGTVAGTIVAVTIAFIYRNVWALVLGRLAGSITRCITSYFLHPYKPRISFDNAKAKELWSYGKHIFSISILHLLGLYGDDAFLGKVLGATSLGFYQLAYRIGNMVATEFGNLIQSVAFPAYSKLQDNIDKLRGGYFRTIKLTSLIVYPISGGIIVLAPEFTEIVLGAKWLPMVPSLQILCLLGLLKCMQRYPVFKAVGRPDIETKLSILGLITMVITIYPLTIKYGIAGTSLSVLIAALGVQPMGFYELQKLIDAKAKDVLKLLSFPVTATLIMMLCVFVTKSIIGDVGLISLLLLICLGAISYAICIFVMSKISKEYDAIALIHDIIKEIRRF